MSRYYRKAPNPICKAWTGKHLAFLILKGINQLIVSSLLTIIFIWFIIYYIYYNIPFILLCFIFSNNKKIFSLLWYMTNKSRKYSHLWSCNHWFKKKKRKEDYKKKKKLSKLYLLNLMLIDWSFNQLIISALRRQYSHTSPLRLLQSKRSQRKLSHRVFLILFCSRSQRSFHWHLFILFNFWRQVEMPVVSWAIPSN